MGKSKRKKKPSGLKDMQGRIKFLLRSLWQDNRAKMAEAVGFSHTAINNIVNGNRSPGRQLLQAIAEHPKVNTAWLLQGEGLPLLAKRSDGPVGEWRLLIATELFAGSPLDHRERLTDELWPVAASDYSATRYFLKILGDQSVATRSQEKVAVGDLLLIETDEKRRVVDLGGRGALCIVRDTSQGAEVLALARVTAKFDDHGNAVEDEVYVERFDRGVPESKLGTRITIELDSKGKVVANRTMPLRPNDHGGAKTMRRVGANAISPPPMAMRRSNVIGVCLRIVRREP